MNASRLVLSRAFLLATAATAYRHRPHVALRYFVPPALSVSYTHLDVYKRQVLKKRFDLWVSDSTVALHLHQMNLSCQKPCYQAQGQDPEKVAHFINNKFKLIQKVAQKIGADIAFEDEAGIGLSLIHI